MFDVNRNKELRREAMLFALCHMGAFTASDEDFRDDDRAVAVASAVVAAKAKKAKRLNGMVRRILAKRIYRLVDFWVGSLFIREAANVGSVDF